MLIAVLGVVAVVVTVAAFMVTRKHPENAADGAGERGGTEFFGDVTDRPAGPGAEADGVPERGQPAPGPSAESLPPPGSVGGGDPEGRRPDHR